MKFIISGSLPIRGPRPQPHSKPESRAPPRQETVADNIVQPPDAIRTPTATAVTQGSRVLRATKSLSQLGPMVSNKINKPALRKKMTRADLKAAFHNTEKKPAGKKGIAEDTEIDAESWAILEEYVESEVKTAELADTINGFNLGSKKSVRRLRKPVPGEDDPKTKEETLRAMKPEEVPVNLYLCISFRSFTTGLPITRDIELLANNLKALPQLNAQMRVETASVYPCVSLQSHEPKAWQFKPRPMLTDNERYNKTEAEVFSRAHVSEDAEAVYVVFLGICYREGLSQAEEAIEEALRKAKHTRKMRKGVAEADVSGYRREWPEVRIPGAVDVRGQVVVFY
jgi:hypothetical protein